MDIIHRLLVVIGGTTFSFLALWCAGEMHVTATTSRDMLIWLSAFSAVIGMLGLFFLWNFLLVVIKKEGSFSLLGDAFVASFLSLCAMFLFGAIAAPIQIGAVPPLACLFILGFLPLGLVVKQLVIDLLHAFRDAVIITPHY